MDMNNALSQRLLGFLAAALLLAAALACCTATAWAAEGEEAAGTATAAVNEGAAVESAETAAPGVDAAQPLAEEAPAEAAADAPGEESEPVDTPASEAGEPSAAEGEPATTPAEQTDETPDGQPAEAPAEGPADTPTAASEETTAATAAETPAAPVARPAKTSAQPQTANGDSTSDAAKPTADTAASTAPKYASVKKLKPNQKKVTIHNDGTFKLKVTLVPDIAGKKIKDKAVTWSISDPKIASISDKGLVKGKKAGTVWVTATAANGKTAKMKVKVVIDKGAMATHIPVLTYHRITTNWAKRHLFNDTNLAMSESLFRSEMKWLKKHGYRTISTAEFRDWRVNGTFLPKKSVLITIDDGFYETYHVAYPILKKYKLKATSFLIGKNIGKTTSKYRAHSKKNHYIGKDVMAKMAEEYPNLEFQSHTYNLHHRGKSGNGVAKFWNRKSIDRDFKRNEAYGFTAAAWPFGHTSKNLKAAAKASTVNIGFGYMMTWRATRTSPLYNIPRYKMFGDRGLSDFVRVVQTGQQWL